MILVNCTFFETLAHKSNMGLCPGPGVFFQWGYVLGPSLLVKLSFTCHDPSSLSGVLLT